MEEAGEQVSQIVRRKRWQARGEFLGSRDPVAANAGTFSWLTEPVEYFSVGRQKRHESFGDSSFEFMRRDSDWTIAFAARVLDRNLRNVIAIPIDAKFPVEDYQRLIDAQERADVEGVESAGKHLENRVKSCARDISEKYLNPPKTTDFGILFLPIEGLFAEVIRRTGLVETIQRECRVIIAGPTTLWSILNSLQMGFRTLAIEKRSSEVWNLLAAVKTEWTKYGEILEAVERKLHQASDTIEKAKVRTKAIGRKLRDVQELPAADIAALLPKNEVESIENGDTEGDVEDGETPWWKVP